MNTGSMFVLLMPDSVSAARRLQVARPVAVDGRTHVLFHQQVHPLRVSYHTTVDKNTVKRCWKEAVTINPCYYNVAFFVCLCHQWGHKFSQKKVFLQGYCVSAVSHLFLTLCMRRRKAQKELCLALDRRYSAYLLENSMSPSCLLRSSPADSSCLKHSQGNLYNS